MKFIVLGNNGPFAGAGNACSGYLIQTLKGNILIDMGSGILSRYLMIDTLNNLKAIILTHLHYDHMSDILTLRYALESVKIQNLPVYIPSLQLQNNIIEKENLNDIFTINYIKNELNILDIHFKFLKTIHPIEAYAVSFYLNNLKYTYTSDSGYFDELVKFAENSDILISDSAFLNSNKKANIHMSASESALLAKNAKAGKLYLTHLYPLIDPELYLNEAKNIFQYTYLTKEMQCI